MNCCTNELSESIKYVIAANAIGLQEALSDETFDIVIELGKKRMIHSIDVNTMRRNFNFLIISDFEPKQKIVIDITNSKQPKIVPK